MARDWPGHGQNVRETTTTTTVPNAAARVALTLPRHQSWGRLRDGIRDGAGMSPWMRPGVMSGVRMRMAMKEFMLHSHKGWKAKEL